MLNEDSTARTIRMPIPFESRPPATADNYPETPASRQAAKLQQRLERAQVIADEQDSERSIDGRLLLDMLIEEHGVDRIHRWVRNSALIRAGKCPCESLLRDVR